MVVAIDTPTRRAPTAVMDRMEKGGIMIVSHSNLCLKRSVMKRDAD